MPGHVALLGGDRAERCRSRCSRERRFRRCGEHLSRCCRWRQHPRLWTASPCRCCRGSVRRPGSCAGRLPPNASRGRLWHSSPRSGRSGVCNAERGGPAKEKQVHGVRVRAVELDVLQNLEAVITDEGDEVVQRVVIGDQLYLPRTNVNAVPGGTLSNFACFCCVVSTTLGNIPTILRLYYY
jgi:hypothetical protein